MKRNLTEKEFMDLRKGTKVYVRVGEKFYRAEVVRSAFYNPDSEEPDWEVETTQGCFDNSSLYIETEPPAHCLLVRTDGYSIEYADYQNLEQAYGKMRKEYEDYKPKDMNEEAKEMSYINDHDAILWSGDTVYVWRIIEI